MPQSILFVCLGNICRSPLAEGAFRTEAERRGLDVEIDSAGTGNWHVGEPPDPRAVAVAQANDVDIGAQRARQVHPRDFEKHDWIVALDGAVLDDLQAMRPDGARAEVMLFLDHVEGRSGEDVADPYYGQEDGFAVAWTDVTTGARALADRIEAG